jgi:IS66 C-terminal element
MPPSASRPASRSAASRGTLAGSGRGGERAAIMSTLIRTARLNGADPRVRLADVLARINDDNIQNLDPEPR